MGNLGLIWHQTCLVPGLRWWWHSAELCRLSLLFCPFCPQYSGFHYLCCTELSSKPFFPNFALSYVIELCPIASPAHPCSWPPCDIAQALHLGLQDSTGPCPRLHVRSTLFKPDLDSPPLPVCSLSLCVSAASSWESLASFPLTFAGTCPFTDCYCLEWIWLDSWWLINGCFRCLPKAV